MQINHPFLLTMTDAGEGGGGTGDGGAGKAAGGAGDGGQGGEGGNSGNYTPPATQADLDRIVTDRLARERARFADYDDLKAKVTEFEQSGMTDAQKLAAERDQFKASGEAATSQLTQLNVALKHGFVLQDDNGNFTVDQDALSLLGTGSEEDLDARAKTIAALRSKQQQETPPAFSHGPRGTAPASSMNDLLFGNRK